MQQINVNELGSRILDYNVHTSLNFYSYNDAESIICIIKQKVLLVKVLHQVIWTQCQIMLRLI